MSVWRSAAGMLRVELTSAELEQALCSVNAAGIEISHMYQVSELTSQFCVKRSDCAKLRKLCEKRGETLRILGHMGLFWTLRSLTARPVLIVGVGLLISGILYLPTRVLFVQIQGNNNIPSAQILEAAEACGICFGASRREVRSEKVKNALLSAVPDLQWAGVNTSGCVATILVRERTDEETDEKENTVSNIVAVRDGYVLSGTVMQGTPAFQPGQTVKTGQILISGYTDCGICIRATRSEGEIYAQTNRKLEAVTPSVCLKRGEIQGTKRKISVLIRKKRINLWKDSGISDASCGRMYKESYITLPGGFQLPIALCVETCHSYSIRTADVLQPDAEDSLDFFVEKYLRQQMVAGEVTDKEQSVSQEEGIYRLTGEYVCREMIGREQREQIGDTNGKSG